MSVSRTLSRSTLFHVAATAVIFLIAAAFAQAQSCPGGFLQVQNRTGCVLTVRLITIPAIAPIVVGPGATVGVAVTPGTIIQKVRSSGGVDYTFPPIPPEPACTPAITMAPGCCARVCLFPHNCIVQINPAPAPCLP